jgi:hypothetical protein
MLRSNVGGTWHDIAASLYERFFLDLNLCLSCSDVYFIF